MFKQPHDKYRKHNKERLWNYTGNIISFDYMTSLKTFITIIIKKIHIFIEGIGNYRVDVILDGYWQISEIITSSSVYQ